MSLLRDHIKNKINKIRKSKAAYFFFSIVMLLIILDLVFPPHQMKEFSKVVLDKNGTLLTAYLTSDDKWRIRTNLNEVSEDLIKAVIEKEDKWFYWHLGVNPVSVVRALLFNITSGKKISGASTITMQVARLLNPAERTYLNKFLEMIRVAQLELHYSKDEILEMYLSLLPMGGNIEGIKSASFIYFNRPPGKLSLAQSILLVVIPNDPNNLRPDQLVKRAKEKRNYWINNFIEDDVFNRNDLADALEEELTPNRFAIPQIALHFSAAVKNKTADDVITTSLDLGIQRVSEKLLKNYVRRVKGKGVSNGSVIVIDNRNNAVVGYCGSADFYDDINSGQVNGITAVRSPGSALKPFLYAQALDAGLFTPKIRLLDVPTDFGGFLPENYDLNFNGSVTFQSALINSLNIPAVRLLRKVGYNDFINLLVRGKFHSITHNKDRLGLSVILGGCGVTLEELVRFYACFANGGQLIDLNYFNHNSPSRRGINIFSKESSFIISEILSGNKRPDFPNILSNSSKLPRIAWKTGTSYGKRDGWAIGFNPNYTIGVWMGNFNGKGSPHLSGAEMAVPLLFELFNSIDYDSEKRWFTKPDKLLRRKICSETGLLPSALCENIIDDYFIKDISHNIECVLSKEIYCNTDSSFEYCRDCLPVEGYKKIVTKFYEPELNLWYEQNNIEYGEALLHNPECIAKFTDGGPIIVSPSSEFEYFIETDTDQKIKLLAANDAGAGLHYWYVNDKFYGSTNPSEALYFNPVKGNNKVQCVDDKGRESTANVKVNYY